MEQSIGDLKSKGYVSVPYPEELRQVVEEAALAWIDFCALSPEIKKSLPYSNNADGVGYELKDGSGKAADKKENFDVTLAGKQWLEDHINEINNPTALRFLELAVRIIPVLEPLIIEFAVQAEKEFGMAGFADDVRGSREAFFVRFIHNFSGVPVGEEMTTTHPDQSMFTPHLFATDPGLRFYGIDGQWIDVPVSTEETVIIPAMQMQLRSRGELKALNHNVIATPETTKTGRYSGVCFVQAKNTPKYDKDRWGRLQEMIQTRGLGFNYHMPPEEFEMFFKN